MVYIEKGGKKFMLKEFKSFLKDEEGAGVVEVVLILLVVIGLVVIFKSEIEGILTGIFRTLKNKVRVINVYEIRELFLFQR